MCAGLGKKRSSDARQQRARLATLPLGQATGVVFMTAGAAWGEMPALMYNKFPEDKVSFSHPSPLMYGFSLCVAISYG
jgi:hypothetical protein